MVEITENEKDNFNFWASLSKENVEKCEFSCQVFTHMGFQKYQINT